MEAECKAINDAFNEIVAHLDGFRARYLEDLSDPDIAPDYKGITKEDAYIWFIESL